MVTEVFNHDIEPIIAQEDFCIVDFYGTHCGACVMLEPVYNEASNRFSMIRFCKANTDENAGMAEKYDIKALPTVVFFRNGVPVHRTTGAMNKEMLKGHIAKMLYE